MMNKVFDSTVKGIALAILTRGEDKLKGEDVARYAEILGVSTRTIYRYLDKIGRAKFYIKEER